MANNIAITDSGTVTQFVKTTQTATVHVPHHNVDTLTCGFISVTGPVTISGAVMISGPVTVSGTVFASPSGVYTISGAVAISGPVTISGTVFASPSGVYTISGTIAVSTVSGVVLTSGTMSGLYGWITPSSSVYTQAAVGFNTVSNNVIVAGTTGQTIRVFGIFVHSTCALTMIFKDGATLLTSGMGVAANTQINMPRSPDPLFVSTTSIGFQINTSASGQVGGSIWYIKS